MNLSVDEQQLIAKFRRLDLEGQKELLGQASLLLQKRERPAADGIAGSADNQCQLKQAEVRPEASAEPIFTE